MREPLPLLLVHAHFLIEVKRVSSRRRPVSDCNSSGSGTGPGPLQISTGGGPLPKWAFSRIAIGEITHGPREFCDWNHRVSAVGEIATASSGEMSVMAQTKLWMSLLRRAKALISKCTATFSQIGGERALVEVEDEERSWPCHSAIHSERSGRP